MTANPKQAYGDKKVPLHLNPPAAEIYMAVGLREGLIKYGGWNYREIPIELMTYIGAIKRHIDAIVDGEWIDPDPVLVNNVEVQGLPRKPHLAGVLASAAILADAYENGNLVDNRPKPGRAPELLKRYQTEGEEESGNQNNVRSGDNGAGAGTFVSGPRPGSAERRDGRPGRRYTESDWTRLR